MRPTIQDILREHLDDFLGRHRLPAYQRQAAHRMRDCRTAAMGGHVIGCPQGHVHRIVYNSCRHRSCPQCALLERERWLAAWQARLLDCPHHHVVFTVPHDLLWLWRYNKRLFAGALFWAASQALMELLADPKYLGSRVGMLAALHTWGQTLRGHVHLHVLVTAGGLTAKGRWKQATRSCLLPRKVLMIKFRGKRKVMPLPVDEFLSRLLERVPPPNLQTVRGYGLYAGSKRAELTVARQRLGQPPLSGKLEKISWQELCVRPGRGEQAYCPVCGARLQLLATFARGRDPPWPYGTSYRGPEHEAA